MTSQRGEIILKNLAQELLTPDECEDFKYALNHFRASRSLPALCTRLGAAINSTEKMLLLIELSHQLPEHLIDDFHRLCNMQYENYSTFVKAFSPLNSLKDNSKILAKDSTGSLRMLTRKDEQLTFIDDDMEVNSKHGTSVTSGIYSETDNLSTTDDDTAFINAHNSGNRRYRNRYERAKEERVRDSKRHKQMGAHARKIRSKSLESPRSHHATHTNPHNTYKRVLLKRQGDGSLGLTIRGGIEDGTPILVQHVVEDGQAAKQGLRVGDRVIDVSGNDSRNMTHAEAVLLMRNAWNLILTVERSPYNSNQLMNELKQTEGRMNQLNNRLSEKTVYLLVHPTRRGKLGCMITRHMQSGTVIVKDVDGNSAAEKGGLCPGDVLIKIEGLTARDLSEKQMSSLMQNKRVRMEIRRKLQQTEIQKPTNPQPEPTSQRHRIQSTSFESELASVMKSFDETLDDNHGSSVTSPGRTSQIYDFPTDTTGNSPEPEEPKGDNWLFLPKHSRYITKSTNRGEVKMNGDLQRGREYGRHSASNIKYQKNTTTSGKHKGKHAEQILQRRGRSLSPRSGGAFQNEAEKREVISAINTGLEKRQRAIRLSLYDSPSQEDDDWKVT